MYGPRIAGGFAVAFATSLLAGCGGGGSKKPPPPPPPTTFTVAGTVSGLAGAGLVLQNNGGNDLAVAQNGAFTFTTSVANGNPYNVTVLTQPASPNQACTVANGSGTITGNVTNVAVTCVTGAFTVGGSISGLATGATGLVITNNGADQHVINTNGAFTFPTPATIGSTYSIGVLSQPFDPYQTCVVENGTGVVTNAAITAPTITCTTLVSRFASSLDFGTATYSQYAIDASTGQLRARGFVPVGRNPVDIGADGFDAKISFVLSRGDAQLHAFLRDPVTGRVTEASNSPQSTGAVIPNGDPALGAATLTLHPKLPFVYVANGGGTSTIAGFRFDSTTAALTTMGSPFAAGTRPIKLAIESTGRFGFAVNLGDETISAFSIDQTTGALTANGAALPIGATLPVNPVIHPSGKFVYVPTNSGSIAAFSIGGTGALTAVANSPFVVTPNLTSPIVFHPSGKFLFVKALAGNAEGSVTALAINENSGALSIIGAPVSVGINPTTLWSESSGRYLFVANRGVAPQTVATTGSISILRINQSTGELTTSQTIEPLVPAPYSVSLDWSGKYLYSASAEGNIVRTYAFNLTTGAATPIDDVATMFVRGAPVTLLAIPSAAAEPAEFRSKFAYVPNRATNSVLAYSISSSGVVTPTGGASGSELSGVEAVAVTPHSSRLVAVNSFGTANATTLPINSTTGALGATSSAALAGTDPVAVATEPSGRFAYAADRTSNVIHAFAINPSNGDLTAIGTSAATDPLALAVHPNGRFVYHVSPSQWGVRTIDTANGTLSPNGSDTAGGGNNTAIAIHPSGRFAYVTRRVSPGQIDRYDVLNSGLLVGRLDTPTTTQSAGNEPIAITVHPTGRFVYVANNLSSDVAAFRVSPSDGALSLIGGVTTPLSSRPMSLRADYSGNYLYVVDNASQILTFAINGTTGALSATASTAPAAAAQQLAVSEDIE